MRSFLAQHVSTLLLSLIVICLVALIGIVLQNRSQSSPTSTEQVALAPTIVPSRSFTMLSAVAAKPMVSVGEKFAIDIKMDTNDNLVNGAQLVLHYDPKVLAVDSVKEGTFLPDPFVIKNEVKNGNILFVLDTLTPQKGSGILATLSVRALSKTSGEVLTIEPTSLVTEFQYPQSVLKDRKGATLVIR